MKININNLVCEKFDGDWNNLENFLLAQELDYPNHDKWVKDSKKEIISDIKKTYLFKSQKDIVGDVIFSIKTMKSKRRPEGEVWSLLRIRNFYIAPTFRGKGLGNILLKVVESEAKISEVKGVMVDFRANNKKLADYFYYENNYNHFTLRTKLYDSNQDLIYIKYLHSGYLLDMNEDIVDVFGKIED